MKKIILRTALFFLIFALLFSGVTHLLTPKNNSSQAGIHDYWAKGFLAEPENTIDVLFLGDSELYSCVVPMQIWAKEGITSYTCSTNDQILFQTESYLHRVLENQSPKLVFLETNTIYRDYSYTDIIPHIFEERFPLIRYHDRWKKLSADDFTDPIRFTTISSDKGYMYFDDIEPADASFHMAPTDELAPISSKNVRHLRSIRDYCREQGAQLILFSSPSTANWDYYRHNGVAQLAEELGVAYIDMNLMPEEIPIDWQLDTRDNGDHMNFTGATKVTAYLSRYLAETGLFEDKRQQEAYASWNEALAETGYPVS